MKILDALLVLKEQAIKGSVNVSSAGICYNLSEITDDYDLSYDFVAGNCSDWEFFSGCTLVPIDGYGEDFLWEGRQLALRLSLIDHLIVKAEQQGV